MAKAPVNEMGDGKFCTTLWVGIERGSAAGWMNSSEINRRRLQAIDCSRHFHRFAAGDDAVIALFLVFR